jgi:UDP-N-acetyl-D-mannosaminuronic acid dehydrogenase
MLAKADVGELLVVEPNVKELPASLRDLHGLRKVELREALSEADIVVLLVDHRQFLRVDRELLDLKIVIDTRGAWRTSTPEKYSA